MRPEIVLSEDQKKIVEDCSGRMTTEQLADLLGIGRQTFFNILKRDESVNVLYKKGRAEIIDQVSSVLVENALDGDTTSIIFYLKTQAGWKETQLLSKQPGEEEPPPTNIHFTVSPPTGPVKVTIGKAK